MPAEFGRLHGAPCGCEHIAGDVLAQSESQLSTMPAGSGLKPPMPAGSGLKPPEGGLLGLGAIFARLCVCRSAVVLLVLDMMVRPSACSRSGISI